MDKNSVKRLISSLIIFFLILLAYIALSVQTEGKIVIKVMIVTAAEEVAVPDATINIWQGEDQGPPILSNIKTDIHGMCNISSLAPGNYFGEVIHKNYVEKNFQFVIKRNDTRKDIFIILEKKVYFQVMVKSRDLEIPIQEANVSIAKYIEDNSIPSEPDIKSNITNELGFAEFAEVIPGKYKIKISHDEYAFFEKDIEVDSKQNLQKFLLNKGIPLLILCLDENSHPLANYFVSIRVLKNDPRKYDRIEGLTNNKGEFRTAVADNTNIIATVRGSSENFSKIKKAVINKEQVNVLKFFFENGHKVHGIVTMNKEPLSDIVMTIAPAFDLYKASGTQGYVRTNIAGNYVFVDVEHGEYYINLTVLKQLGVNEQISRKIIVPKNDLEFNIEIGGHNEKEK